MRNTLAALALAFLPVLAQAQSINTPPIAPTAGMLDIKAYGAKCDGVTDDQPAILAAITAASSGNIRVVYSPPSQTPCMIGSAIVLPAAGNITLWAYPGTVSWKVTATNAGNPQLLNGGTNQVSNVLVYGLDLDGNIQGQFAAGGAAASGRLMSFFRSNNVVFDHVSIHDTNTIPIQFGARMTHSGVRNSTLSNVGMHWMNTGLLSGVAQGITFTASNSIFTASITGSVMTVSAMITNPVSIAVGASVTGAGITAGTRIISLGTGSGGNGTYNLSASYGSPVSSETMASSDRDLNVGNFVEDTTFIAFGGTAVNAYTQVGFSFQRNKCFLGSDASFTASISGSINLAVTGVASGFLKPGQYVYGLNVPDGTKIVAYLSGGNTGFTGSYSLNTPVGTSVASETMYAAGSNGQLLPSLQSFFSNVGQACVLAAGSKGVTIAGNQSWAATEGAYSTSALQDYVISGNYARWNGIYGVAITTGAIYGYTDGSNNGNITGNTILNTGTQYASGTGHPAGITMYTGTSGATNGPILNTLIAGNTFVTDDPAGTTGYGVAIADFGSGLPTVKDVAVADSNQMLGLVQGPFLNMSFTVTGCSATVPVGSQRSGKFTSGTTGTCTPVITIGGASNPQTAPNGYRCTGTDVTTGAALNQTATTTTTCTLSGATTSGDTVAFSAVPY
jgi:hypothetical protein